MRGLHRFWVAEGLVDVDVTREVRSPQLPRRLPKAMGVQAVVRLLDAPDTSTPLGLRDRALLEVLYATGARISEVVRLDVDDVVGSDGDLVHVLRAHRQGRQAARGPRGQPRPRGAGRLPGPRAAGPARRRRPTPGPCCATPAAAG